jgi:hypothetical protein
MMPDGEALVSVLVDPNSEAARWRETIAQHTRVRWKGREISILVAGRVYGELGRLQTLLEQERRRGPLIGVSRGNVLGGIRSQLKGPAMLQALERLGLKYSAVSSLEIGRWDAVTAYRSSSPAGVQFLSANLVYSTAPAVSLLPGSVIVPVGGLRVALVGLTPLRAAKYLGQGGLTQAAVLDPLKTLQDRAAALRKDADAVVVLTDLEDDESDLRMNALGVDVLVARNLNYQEPAPAPEVSIEQKERREFHPPLWVMTANSLSLNVLEAEVTAARGVSRWSLRERHRLLDDSVDPAAGWPEFDPADYGITFSTQPPLLPGGRLLYPAAAGPQRGISSRDFWSLAASLGAASAGAEVGVLRAWPLPVELVDPVPERVVRVWLGDEEPAVLATVKGRDLKTILAAAQTQREREAARQPPPSLPYTFGGVDADLKIRGLAIEDDADYKVFTSPPLAEALQMSPGRPPRPLGKTVDEIVLAALSARADAPVESVRDWLDGRSAASGGLWRVNFRDVGLNVQNTKVVRDDAFNAVPNSRIQGFDELLIGEVFKADAEYLRRIYRWSNTLELEYARSRIRPRDQPAVTNTTANRIMFLTTASRRAGLIQQSWFAKTWGPSLGFQYDGQFEPTPGLRRKQIYSAFPGVSFFDGDWIKLLELSGNVKRDLSRDPPNTQPGLHGRLLLSRTIASARTGPISLQGEWYANYFFLTRADTEQDLRLEGDANLKLRVPIRKYLSIAPFIDFYYFSLKTRPLWGYSAMTGVQIGFSRLWKPQYEPLLGER